MPRSSFLTRGRTGFAFALALTLAVAACVAPRTEPRQAEAQPPAVSYTYENDQDLLAANERARNFCAAYQTVPSMDSNIVTEADGTKKVTFQCLKSPPVATPVPSTPPMPTTQTYRTDVELLQAMNAADRQCAHFGQRASSSITTNPDGTKTITFRCVAG